MAAPSDRPPREGSSDPSPPEPTRPAAADDTEQRIREAEDLALAASGLGSGLLLRQNTPEADEAVAVPKVCPQCGTEYETAARFCPNDGTALRPKGSDSLIDRVLADRYHILKRIGEGGMGRVYLGEHVKMNRQCAIKVMSPALVNDHESAMRFAREASSAARIIHPNVAAVFDYGESEGLVYLVMEYVEGEPLSRILSREAPLSVERSVELTRQIADGLGAAHELGIIHRDLKPDNILVSRTRAGREVAKVVDFGIAKAMQETAGEELTRTGLVIGTPEFMSPEQLLGDPIDARADLYALGCILHLMLTAAPPFEAPTREQMIKRRLAEEAPHVKQLDPGLPESLDRIVHRLLARTPADRYSSAAEVRDALGGMHSRLSGAAPLDVRPSSLTPRSLPTVAFDAAANAPTEQSPRAVAPSPASSRRGRLIAAGAAIVLLGGLAKSGVFRAAVPESLGRADSVRLGPTSAQKAGVTPKSTSTLAPPVAAPLRVDTQKKPVKAALSAEAADSVRLARAARAKADSARRASSAVPAGIRQAVDGYVAAIQSGDINQLRAAAPTLSDQQRAYWENSVFAIGEKIRARLTYGRVSASGNTATVPVSIKLNYLYKKSGSPASTPLHQTLTLEQQGAKWVIREIR